MATMEEYGSVASRKDCPAANSAPEKGLPTYRKLKLEQLRCEVGAGLADLEAGRVVDGGEAFEAVRGELGDRLIATTVCSLRRRLAVLGARLRPRRR